MPPRSLDPLIKRLRSLKANQAECELEIRGNKDPKKGEITEGLQPQIVGLFRKRGIKTRTIDEGAIAITATLVAGSEEVIDPAKLKKALGAAKWGKVTTLVLDKKKLQDAMARGLVDPNIVASCSETVDRAPYIKITEKTSEG